MPGVSVDADPRWRRQLVVEVVAARPVAGVAVERLPAEAVAARARDDVHHGTAGIRFAHAARHGHRRFVGVHGVEDVRRHAAAVECRGDRQPVHRHAAFVGLAAARAEERHRRRRVHAIAVHRQSRRGIEEVADRPSAGHGLYDLRVEHDFPSDALYVDDRRLTSDGDRFLQRANAQLNRDRDDRRALELYLRRVGPR